MELQLPLPLHTVISGAEYNKYHLNTYKFVDHDHDNNKYSRNGLEYKIGEITYDPIEFNTHTCTAGGMYFFEESQISNFDTYYGYTICKVTIPDDSRVFIEEHKFKTDKIILTNPVEFKDFCANKTNIADNLVQYYFKKNVYFGNESAVKLLLQDLRVDPSADNNYAFCYASSHGYENIVKMLLQDGRINPRVRNNVAIRYGEMERDVLVSHGWL